MREGSHCRLVGDRDELPIDFRLFHLLLRASGDPEIHLGNFAQGEGWPWNSDAQITGAVQASEATETAGTERPVELLGGRTTVGEPLETELRDACWFGRQGGLQYWKTKSRRDRS